ncbi:hypothetical protein [Kutzneria sp. NPDC052558]|uniref:hypothetical protein n=1 Tax=Kutzneria sp. NPDC052558 TaxID=3364121 RepID=UPI0037CC0F2D
MRRSLTAALAIALTAAVVSAPTASASIGPGTSFTPDSVWVHMRPTLDSAHATINKGPNIAAMCWYYDGQQFWDLIVDYANNIVGYTLESYLTTAAYQSCMSLGHNHRFVTDVWVHFQPRGNTVDYEALTMATSTDIAAACTVPNIQDPSDGNSIRTWYVVVDHGSNVAGFTWASSVAGPVPPPC